MADLEDFSRLVRGDHGLSIVSVARRDGTVASSLVNAGVLAHPADGHAVVGFVAQAAAYKIRRLRADPRVTVVVRAGWEWTAVEGRAELAGPLDEPSFDIAIAQLLRDVFRAAGGTHDDWDTYDRVMAEEQRTAVLVEPVRVYGNVGA